MDENELLTTNNKTIIIKIGDDEYVYKTFKPSFVVDNLIEVKPMDFDYAEFFRRTIRLNKYF